MDRVKTGVYIHIPFCRRKCNYCDFVSFAGMDDYFESYINSLINEIDNTKELYEAEVETIFIGGGTPSILPSYYIEKIMDRLSHFNINQNAEITIEANPESVNKKKLLDYKAYGVNRLSIGLQALQNGLLESLGRVHRREDFIRAFETARNAGFDNINVDLMFALPLQKIKDWEETLLKITEFKPEHISAYSLILEENTPFYEAYNKGEISLLSDEADREMYYTAKHMLKEKGYSQYEISNFALSDFYSRHNVIYWKRGNYLGFGVAAHSLYRNRRYGNISDLSAYIRAYGDLSHIRENEYTLSVKEQMEEFMFLGLRLTEGISERNFYEYFNSDINKIYFGAINKNLNSGLLAKNNGRVYLTEKGVDLSNRVMADFLFE